MSDERADRPADLRLRASDAERDVVAGRLREAHAEGRLTVEEFSERLDAALAARTRGDLEALTRDLPAALPARRRPRTGDEAAPARRGSSPPTGLRAAWGVWALAVLVNLVVWGVVSLAEGGPVYFWPGWVAGPWGAVLLVRTLAGGRARGEA
jgi:hypothetical protein